MADASPGTRRGGLRRSSQSRSHNPPALRPRESRSPDRVASRGQRGECRCSGPSAGGGRDGGGQDRRRRSPSVPGRGRSGSRSRGPPAAAKVAAPEILGAAANAADATPGPDRDDGRRRAAKRKGGRVAGARTAAAADQRGARSGSGRSTRRGIGTTVDAALAERNGGRILGARAAAMAPRRRSRRVGSVAGAHAAAVADRRAAVPGRRSTPHCRSGTAAGPQERAQRQRQIDTLRYRDDGRYRAGSGRGAGGSVASPEHTQRQRKIAAPRCRDDGRRRTAGVERR